MLRSGQDKEPEPQVVAEVTGPVAAKESTSNGMNSFLSPFMLHMCV